MSGYQVLRLMENVRQVLDDLADPDPCDFDHNGACQAHMWFTDERPCPHARAKRLLADWPKDETA